MTKAGQRQGLFPTSAVSARVSTLRPLAYYTQPPTDFLNGSFILETRTQARCQEEARCRG
jgi:hypothetical protein